MPTNVNRWKPPQRNGKKPTIRFININAKNLPFGWINQISKAKKTKAKKAKTKTKAKTKAKKAKAKAKKAKTKKRIYYTKINRDLNRDLNQILNRHLINLKK